MRGKYIQKGWIIISISGQINRIKDNISAAYAALRSKGAEMPGVMNSLNLSETINDIEAGITPTGSKSISLNGTYDVTEYAKAIVSVNPTLVQKTITANGNYNASSDNADGYSGVSVNIPLGSQNSICTIKTLTESPSTGWVTFSSANTLIAAHRSDASFSVGIIATTASQPRSAFRAAISCSVNLAENYTSQTQPIYGIYMRTSTSGIVGIVQNNSFLTATSTAGAIYVDTDGNIKAYSSSTYPICEGTYLVMCGW